MGCPDLSVLLLTCGLEASIYGNRSTFQEHGTMGSNARRQGL